MNRRYLHNFLIFAVLMILTVGLVACDEDTNGEIDVDNDGDTDINIEVKDNVDVSLENTRFEPASVTVDAGTTVVWTNNDEIQHTVTADNGTFDSGTLATGETFSYTFNEPGVYPYHCQFHGVAGGTGMVGLVTVE